VNQKKNDPISHTLVRPSRLWPALLTLITAIALMCFASMAQAAWYDSSWQYRKKPNIITWVKIMSIWDTDGTQTRMHCGNGSGTSQQNAKATWYFGGSNDSRSVFQQPGV
jgi:hypothetical protein